MIKIRMTQGIIRYDCANPRVSLTRYAPEKDVEAITPELQKGIDRKLIMIVKQDVPFQDQEEVAAGDSVRPDDAVQDVVETVEEAPVETPVDDSPTAPKEGSKRKRPSSQDQCIGTTKGGARCGRMALRHSKFCSTHCTPEELANIDAALDAEEAGD